MHICPRPLVIGSLFTGGNHKKNRIWSCLYIAFCAWKRIHSMRFSSFFRIAITMLKKLACILKRQLYIIQATRLQEIFWVSRATRSKNLRRVRKDITKSLNVAWNISISIKYQILQIWYAHAHTWDRINTTWITVMHWGALKFLGIVRDFCASIWCRSQSQRRQRKCLFGFHDSRISQI